MKIFVIVNKHLMEGHPEHIGNVQLEFTWLKLQITNEKKS